MNNEEASPAVEADIEKKIAPRVAEAKLLKVTDQNTLDAIGERLVVNKSLQAEVCDAWDKSIKDAHLLHTGLIAKKKKYLDPLVQEESILKSLSRDYMVERKRIEDAAEAQRAREQQAREREAARIAEEERQATQAEINARLAREHEEEQERYLNSLPPDTPTEEVVAICDEPAPVVELPLEIPAVAPLPTVQRTVAPKGMSMSTKYKAVLDPTLGPEAALKMLCKAVVDGKVISEAVLPNMPYLNKRASADKDKLNIPGVKSVPDTGITQRSR